MKALAVAMLAAPAAADMPPTVHEFGGDRVYMEPTDDPYRYVLTYANHGGKVSNSNSGAVGHVVQGRATVAVTLIVGGGAQGAEVLQIEGLRGFTAVPPRLEVLDGEEGQALIILPAF